MKIITISSSVYVCLILLNTTLVSAENVDRDIGEGFTFDEMFSKEYQPNDFTAKWLGGQYHLDSFY